MIAKINLGSYALAIISPCVCVLSFSPSFAANIPSSVDPGRFESKNYTPAPENKSVLASPSGTAPADVVKSPEGADKVSFVLKDVQFVGVTAFTEDELKSLYADDLGKQIPLSRVWDISNKLTKIYRDKGYFLSRTYIPVQEIEGTPRINVVEGYISEIDTPADWKNNPLIQAALDELQSKKPLLLEDLEAVLLKLNKLPGMSVTSVLGVASNATEMNEGGVKLSLQSADEKSQTIVSFSNMGSNYMGPTILNADWRGQLIKLQDTRVNISLSGDGREIKSGSVSHEIPLTVEDDLAFSISKSISVPGDTLQPQRIRSTSNSVSLTWNHNWLAKRRLDINTNLGVGVRHTVGHISQALLSRDDIRYANLGLTAVGAFVDGNYAINIGVVKGLPFLGGSDKTDNDLSRTRAGTDFQKITTDMRGSYILSPYWQTSLRVMGQYASRSLPSSEEFGFGGQDIGRGYDSSELTGDHGTASSVELAYTQGLSSSGYYFIRPYMFYDIGKVWNINTGQDSNVSASSAGVGVSAYLNGTSYLSGWQLNSFIAKPLTKNIDNPQQGGPDSYQLRFQLSRQF